MAVSIGKIQVALSFRRLADLEGAAFEHLVGSRYSEQTLRLAHLPNTEPEDGAAPCPECSEASTYTSQRQILNKQTTRLRNGEPMLAVEIIAKKRPNGRYH